MLFPLSKDFSSTGIFQSGQHNARPVGRVWSIDHTGSKDRIKELHLLITDQKPYAHHERLATRRAQEGKKLDADTMSAWKRNLSEMNERIDGESAVRRQDMIAGIRDFNKRKAASTSDLKQMLREQGKGHIDFLNEMNDRVGKVPNCSYHPGGQPREHPERTQARNEAFKGLTMQVQEYKQGVKTLEAELAKRGPQEWTAVPKPSNDAIVERRKAQGIKVLTQAKNDYEGFLEGMEDREQQRVNEERRANRERCREADTRLGADKTKLLQAMQDLSASKKAELDGIQARVNGRGNGRPDHPDFSGYATAGYTPVHKSNGRMRDHAAERADRDADHAEGAAKLLCLSMPLGLRNKVVATNPPRNAASLSGTGISTPMDWTDMNWTQRWALISRHAPPAAVQKATQKAGVDAQGMELSATGVSASDQRTLSPRTLGMATS